MPFLVLFLVFRLLGDLLFCIAKKEGKKATGVSPGRLAACAFSL
jgi:hypothetical protein